MGRAVRHTCYYRETVIKNYDGFKESIDTGHILYNALPMKYSHDILKFFHHCICYEKKNNYSVNKGKHLVYGVSYEVMVPFGLSFEQLPDWSRQVSYILGIGDLPHVCCYEKKGYVDDNFGYFVRFTSYMRRYLEGEKEVYEMLRYVDPISKNFVKKDTPGAIKKTIKVVLNKEFSNKKLDVYCGGKRQCLAKSKRVSDSIQELSLRDYGVGYKVGYITKKRHYETTDSSVVKRNTRLYNDSLRKFDVVLADIDLVTTEGMEIKYGKKREFFEKHIAALLENINIIKKSEHFRFYEKGNKRSWKIELDFKEISSRFIQKLDYLTTKICNLRDYLLDIGWKYDYDPPFTKKERNIIYGC